MIGKITILGEFFDNPNQKYSIRELARILKINHTTVREKLNKLVEEKYLTCTKEGLYVFYRLNISRKSLNFKLFYNLEKIRKSGLIDEIEKVFDYPVIVLFGSYAQAIDDETSDVDICIITNVQKAFSSNKYEKKLKRELSLHCFDKKKWQNIKKKNTGLVNSICNGIVLSGELEVL